MINKLKLTSILLLLSLFCFSFNAYAQKIVERPNPPKLVNDFTGTLQANEIDALERKLVALDDSSSNQIAIVIIKSLEGYDVNEYAFKIGRGWGIGSKKTNNGVVILVALEERKIKIEVGKGLEGAIPDITAVQIGDKIIKPAFKTGAYYKGLDEATDALAKAAIGEYKVAKNPKGKKPVKSLWLFVLVAIVIIAIVGRKDNGAGGSNIGGRGINDIATGILLGNIFSGGRGGGDYGGGDSGGGFGGFGGGDFGGGGASSDW
jgi:uncharacterized protein